MLRVFALTLLVCFIEGPFDASAEPQTQVEAGLESPEALPVSTGVVAASASGERGFAPLLISRGRLAEPEIFRPPTR